MEVQQVVPFCPGGPYWVENSANTFIHGAAGRSKNTWTKIGKIGDLRPDLDGEWPIWRLVLEAHQPLSEVLRWDLEDVRKANALLDMRAAHSAAFNEYNTRNLEKDMVKKNGH